MVIVGGAWGVNGGVGRESVNGDEWGARRRCRNEVGGAMAQQKNVIEAASDCQLAFWRIHAQS